jgi:hypothetical protein
MDPSRTLKGPESEAEGKFRVQLTVNGGTSGRESRRSSVNPERPDISVSLHEGSNY